MSLKKSKVAIVGTGLVGSSTAFSLIHKVFVMNIND
ncbi:malate/lactate dehydrogenase [Clostridium saccharobutylicum]|nr:malate/lactate dehydrogenase [Clostridium saccharobutylicum]